MKTLFKYAIVLALGLAVGFYVHGLLSLEDVAKLKWLDEINAIINKPFVAARPAAVPRRPGGRSASRRGSRLSDCPTDRVARRMALVPHCSCERRPCPIREGGGRETASRREGSHAARRGGLKWRVHGRESCERGHGFGPAFPRGGGRGSYA